MIGRVNGLLHEVVVPHAVHTVGVLHLPVADVTILLARMIVETAIMTAVIEMTALEVPVIGASPISRKYFQSPLLIRSGIAMPKMIVTTARMVPMEMIGKLASLVTVIFRVTQRVLIADQLPWSLPHQHMMSLIPLSNQVFQEHSENILGKRGWKTFFLLWLLMIHLKSMCLDRLPQFWRSDTIHTSRCPRESSLLPFRDRGPSR